MGIDREELDPIEATVAIPLALGPEPDLIGAAGDPGCVRSAIAALT